MMLLAPIIGGVAALIGLYVSWSWDFPTGGTIVLVLTTAFLAAWFFAPRNGLIVKTWHRRRPRPAERPPSARDTPPVPDPAPTGAP